MKELLLIVVVLLAVCPLVWVYLKLFAFLDEHAERWFGRSLRRKASTAEIQTLFQGNTKDQDQL